MIRTGQGQYVREVPTQFEHEGLELTEGREGRRDHYAHLRERFWHLQTVAPTPFRQRFCNVEPRPGVQKRTLSPPYHELVELPQKTCFPRELKKIHRSLLRCTQAGMVVATAGFVTNKGTEEDNGKPMVLKH